MVSRLRRSHSEHLAVCTLIEVNDVGDEEHASPRALLPGVRGIEAIRRWPPGVEGMGVRRCTRIVEPGVPGAPGVRAGGSRLGVMSAPGVLGGSRSLGPGSGSGVAVRDMVKYAGVLC